MLGTAKLWVYGLATAAVLGVLLAAGLTVRGWKVEAAKVPGLKQEISNAQATITQIRKDIETANTASQVYQDELARLRQLGSSGPAPVVRLCREPARPGVPVSPAQPGSDGAATAPGVVPPGAGADPGPGRDIGPELKAFALMCDKGSAQVRGLHAFVDGVSKRTSE